MFRTATKPATADTISYDVTLVSADGTTWMQVDQDSVDGPFAESDLSQRFTDIAPVDPTSLSGERLRQIRSASQDADEMFWGIDDPDPGADELCILAADLRVFIDGLLAAQR